MVIRYNARRCRLSGSRYVPYFNLPAVGVVVGATRNKKNLITLPTFIYRKNFFEFTWTLIKLYEMSNIQNSRCSAHIASCLPSVWQFSFNGTYPGHKHSCESTSLMISKSYSKQSFPISSNLQYLALKITIPDTILFPLLFDRFISLRCIAKVPMTLSLLLS